MISNDIEDFIKGQKGNETHFSVKACLCDIHNTIKLALRELQGDQLIQFSRFVEERITYDD